MNDSSPEAARIVRAAIQNRDPIERMRDALQHSDAMRALALTGLRDRYPELDDRELVLRLIGEPLAGLIRQYRKQ